MTSRGTVLSGDYSFHFKLHKMQFFDGTQHIIKENVPYRIRPQRYFFYHFFLLLKPDKTLYVKYILPESTSCFQTRFQELTPFTYDIAKDCQFLTRPRGEPIPFVTYHQFKFNNQDKNQLAYCLIYHVDFNLPNTVLITDRLKRHLPVKRLLSEGNLFYKCKKKTVFSLPV